MLDRKRLSENIAPTSFSPAGISVKKADGNYITSDCGEVYFDLIAGISVCNLGHNNPQIKNAIINQLDHYTHVMVYGEYSLGVQNELAAKLCGLLSPFFDSCFFMNSGAEAIDTAMKLAKRLTGKSGFIAHTQAYHGSTQGPLSLMDNEYFTGKYRPLLNNVQFVEQNAINQLENLDWSNAAAMVIEPIQAEKGISLSTVSYLERVRELCTENNVLLVYDEIQTGMGRTGKMFAFENYGIEPDILVLGKALGGGLPLSAVISSRKYMDSLAQFPVLGNITTFGGHPLSCAASLAAVSITKRVLASEDIIAKERLFKSKLQHSIINEVRGLGLFIAVEFSTDEVCMKVIEQIKNNGVLSDWFLNNAKCMRIVPSLLITEKEILDVCEKIIAACYAIN